MVLAKLTINTCVTKTVDSDQLDHLVPKFRDAQARFDKAIQRVKDCITYSTTDDIPTTLLFIKPSTGPTQEQRDEQKRKREEGKNKDKDDKKPTGCLIWIGGGCDLPLPETLDHLCKSFLRSDVNYHCCNCPHPYVRVNDLYNSQRDKMDTHVDGTDVLDYTNMVRRRKRNVKPKP